MKITQFNYTFCQNLLVTILFIFTTIDISANETYDDFKFNLDLRYNHFGKNGAYKSNGLVMIREKAVDLNHAVLKYEIVRDSIELTNAQIQSLIALCEEQFGEYPYYTPCRHVAPISAFMHIQHNELNIMADSYPCKATFLPIEFIILMEFLESIFEEEK